MLTMANVTPEYLAMDLGAGDGRIAIAAAGEFGARSGGIGYDAEMAIGKLGGEIVQGDSRRPLLTATLRGTVLRAAPPQGSS
jgi:hypothetical protein